MTIDGIKKEYISKLSTVSPTPALEIDLIIANELDKDLSFIYSHNDVKLEDYKITNIIDKIKSRLKHEPLAYIIQEKEFYGNKFKVTADVLIPRIETEFLVTKSLEVLENWNQFDEVQVTEIGTGSGCIIISIAKDYYAKKDLNKNKVEFIGKDISNGALKIAQMNASVLLTSKHRIHFEKADLLENHQLKKHNLVIANLPYIPSREIKGLSQEVQSEPRLALDGGKTGTDLIFKLISQLQDAKPEHLVLLIEIENGQEESVIKFTKESFSYTIDCTVLKDIFGINRFIEISFGG